MGRHGSIALLIWSRQLDRLSIYGSPIGNVTAVTIIDVKQFLRRVMREERKRRPRLASLIDLARLTPTAEGRSRLWTRFVRRSEVHQTTPYTREERYPALFDLALRLAGGPDRILSFGCSTGEELVSLRRRFPNAEIVGAEINGRSRKIAMRRMEGDPRTSVVDPRSVTGPFDLIFALAVLQREPHKIEQMGADDLSAYYPHERFDAAVRRLGEVLRPGGFLCVANAQYRIEDSSAATLFEPVAASPLMTGPLFGPDGRHLEQAVARTMFRKRLASS